MAMTWGRAVVFAVLVIVGLYFLVFHTDPLPRIMRRSASGRPISCMT